MQQLHFFSIKEAEVTWPKNNRDEQVKQTHSPNYLSNLTTFAKMQHLYVSTTAAFCQDELTLLSLKQSVSWETWFLAPSVLQVTFKIAPVGTFHI